jgi:hypothetical protein
MAASKSYPGVYRATVVNTTDPQQLGRVQVLVPDISEMGASWAQACTAFGDSSPATPQVGDTAWVAFEGGDVTHPVVLGKSPS